MSKSYGFHCYLNRIGKVHFATSPGLEMPLADIPRLNLDDLNEVQTWLSGKKSALQTRFKVLRATERYQIISRWSAKHEKELKLRVGSATALLQLGCYLVTVLDAKFRSSTLAETATGSRKVATKEGIKEVSNLEGFANPDAVRSWFQSQFRILKSVVCRFDTPIVNDAASGSGDLAKVKKALETFVNLNKMAMHDTASSFVADPTTSYKTLASDSEIHITVIALSCIMSQMKILLSLVDTTQAGFFDRQPVQTTETETYVVPKMLEPAWCGNVNLDVELIKFSSMYEVDRFIASTKSRVQIAIGEIAGIDLETGAPAITEEGVEVVTSRLIFDILNDVADMYLGLISVQKELPYLHLRAELGVKLAAANGRDLTDDERLLTLLIPANLAATSVDVENDTRAYEQLKRQTAKVVDKLKTYLDLCFHRADTPVIGSLSVYVKNQNGVETIYRVMGRRPVMRFARSISFQTDAELSSSMVTGSIKQEDFVWSQTPDSIIEEMSKGPSAFEFPGKTTRQDSYVLSDIEPELLHFFRRCALITCSYVETTHDAVASTVAWEFHTDAATLVPPSDGLSLRTFGRRERRVANGELFDVRSCDPTTCSVDDLLMLWRRSDVTERTEMQLLTLYEDRLKNLTRRRQLGMRDVRMSDVLQVESTDRFGLYVLLSYRTEEILQTLAQMVTRVYMPISVSECLVDKNQIVKAVDTPAKRDFEFRVPLSFIEPAVVEHWKGYQKDYHSRLERDGVYHITVVRPSWINHEEDE